MPIVNPEEEIREELSHFSSARGSGAPHDFSHPHQADHHVPRTEQDDILGPEQIPLQSQGSKSIIDLLLDEPPAVVPNEKMIYEHPNIIPQSGPHPRPAGHPHSHPHGNIHNGPGDNYRDASPPELNISSSMTHIRIYDIEVDKDKMEMHVDLQHKNDFSDIDWPEQQPYMHDDTLSGNSGTVYGYPINKQLNTKTKYQKGRFDPMAYFRRRGYKVGPNLKSDWKVQAGFFAKIMLIKAFQLLFINAWFLIVVAVPEIKEAITRRHDWFYLALGIFLVLLFIIRFVARKKSNWHPLSTLIGLIALTTCLAYALAAVLFKYDACCIAFSTWTLFFTFLLLAGIPYMTRVPITANVVPRTGGVFLLLVSVVIFIVVIYTMEAIDVTQYASKTWLPAVIIAETVLWVTLFEIQRVVRGCCFNVSERRWFFTSLYV